MIALAILSVIIGAIYTSWYSIIRGAKLAGDVAAATQRSRISMQTIQEALLSTCSFAGNQKYYAFLGDADGDFASLSFAARLPKSFPRSGKFGDLDVRRVAFSIEPGPDNKRALVLRQSPVFMDPDKDEMEHPVVLARDVNNFIVEYLDPKTGDWITFWENTNQLPRMVRVSLGLGRLDKFSTTPQEVKVTAVALPAHLVQLQWEMPGGQGGLPPGGQPVGGVQQPINNTQIPGQPGNNQFGNPGFGNPGFGNPGFGNPGMGNPGMGNPNFKKGGR